MACAHPQRDSKGDLYIIGTSKDIFIASLFLEHEVPIFYVKTLRFIFTLPLFFTPPEQSITEKQSTSV